MFVDRLALTLTLKNTAQTFEIAAGNIKRFDLKLRPYGFVASFEFWIVCYVSPTEDTLYAEFVKDDLLSAQVTCSQVFEDEGDSPDALDVQGVVVERRVREQAFGGIAGEPVLQRMYSVTVKDRAAAFWTLHRPIELFVDKTLKQLIDAHKPDGLTLDHDWTASSAQYAVLCLPLGSADARASFYDYLMWLLHKHCAGFFYDYSSNKFEIADSQKTYGDQQALSPDDVGEMRAVFPSVARNAVSVLNGWAEASTKKSDIDNTQKVTGIRRDYLMRTAVAKDVTDRVTLETKRWKLAMPQMDLSFAQYPTVTFRPNLAVDVTELPSTIFQSGKIYRVCDVDISGKAVSQKASDDDTAESNSYELEVSARLEHNDEPHFVLPAYTAPEWPILVEGKVVSDVGEKTDGTYQIYTDSSTSLDQYKVTIPLWADQKVVATYNPNHAGGQLYFPLYRDARVLVRLEHDRAFIDRHLDYRPDAKLPQDTQGNQILFGKQKKDATYIRHVYKDAKPILTVLRTKDKDTETLEVSEGLVHMEVKESS